ncbi:large ribosomal subunit protein uL10-like [Leptinotarsa decemlineata]|uniref:large ribosomal subunit protein uL10-like n=1 Tax=Leptinotarsa decemlineata TaxID=7539 RepID=UPI003D307C5E
MLNISLFSYGLQVKQVYDSGTIFAAAILDIKREDLREKFLADVANLATVCLSIGYPTTASAPHSIANRFKNLLAIAVAKISKVTIEIINDVHILKPGDKVGATEATLLNMLNISPFSYGLQVEQVYDSGTIFAAAILDIKREDLREKFLADVANLATV